jgi:aminomethyltransferase
MVEFAGYWMPVSYTSIMEEHRAVREAVGLFDVSHMGEVWLEGEAGWAFADRLVTNDCSRLAPGQVLYTVMCREDGTTVDDLLVYRVKEDGREGALLVVNAANREKDLEHIRSHAPEGIRVEDRSDEVALLALQGPRSLEVLRRCPLFDPAIDRIESMAYYDHLAFRTDRVEVRISRTGYTGERGYEIFLPNDQAERFWTALLEAGAELGIRPVGLAARDTLRFEAGFCLYGHELTDETTPYEAGLGWLVKLRKGDFIGREALEREKREGSKRRLIGLELQSRAIARQGFPVRWRDGEVGRITSGSFAPTLGKSLAMAMVRTEAAWEDRLEVEIRGRWLEARRVSLPFYPSRAREDREPGERSGG